MKSGNRLDKVLLPLDLLTFISLRILLPEYHSWHYLCFDLQDDYRRAIQELDEKEFVTLRLVCAELRNHYVSHSGLCQQSLTMC